MLTKICSKCGGEFPLNGEFFNKKTDNKDGFRGECKICQNKNKVKYREKNRDKIKNNDKRYRENNKEKKSERDRQYRENNIEQVKKLQKEYYDKNKYEVKKRTQNYYEENKDIIKKKMKLYCIKNKDRLNKQSKDYYEKTRYITKVKRAEQNRTYCQANKEKVNIRTQRRRAAKKQLPNTLTLEQWEQIKVQFNNRCAYCNKELPLAQEHVIPLNKGGEYTVNNIICACQSCNSSKGAKDFDSWYKTYKYYSKKREKAILEYLGYENEIQQLKII